MSDINWGKFSAIILSKELLFKGGIFLGNVVGEQINSVNNLKALVKAFFVLL